MYQSKYVSVEGLIGSGKSTLCRGLSEFESQFITLQEPVHIYQNYRGYNPLELAYTDPLRNSAVTQIHIIQSSFHYYSNFLKEKSQIYPYLISERSLFSPNVFVEANRAMGIFSNYVADFLIDYAKNKQRKSLVPDVLVYIKVDPVTCMQRIHDRARSGEEHCSLKYLNHLEQAYLDYIQIFKEQHPDNKVHYLNGLLDPGLCVQELKKLLTD